jgi:hypothetical protein
VVDIMEPQRRLIHLLILHRFVPRCIIGTFRFVR